MSKRIITPKSKILNHLTFDGHKRTSEKLLKKCLKVLQKSNLKSHNNLIELALMNITPVFKVTEKRKKKEKKKNRKIRYIPSFIINDELRISYAIKTLLKKCKKTKTNNNSSYILSKEFIINAQSHSDLIKLKNENQKLAIINKKYLNNYKWLRNLNLNTFKRT